MCATSTQKVKSFKGVLKSFVKQMYSKPLITGKECTKEHTKHKKTIPPEHNRLFCIIPYQ